MRGCGAGRGDTRLCEACIPRHPPLSVLEGQLPHPPAARARACARRQPDAWWQPCASARRGPALPHRHRCHLQTLCVYRRLAASGPPPRPSWVASLHPQYAPIWAALRNLQSNIARDGGRMTRSSLHSRLRAAILHGIDTWNVFSIARGEELRPFSTCV